jgi:hypothetical protein
MSPEPLAGSGNEHGNGVYNGPRSGVGLRKKQCEESAPTALFFWTCGLPCWRKFGQREDLPKIDMAHISGSEWGRRSTCKSAIEKRGSRTALQRESVGPYSRIAM